jgi:hypothetical protein
MEVKAVTPHPRVLLGKLETATQVRCAFRRLGQAVLDGKIVPKVANSAMYALSGAGRALELEIAERMSAQLNQLQQQPPGRLEYGMQVLEAEVAQ